MSEETFVRELERRSEDVLPRHLAFEDVRATAHGIRRRRRLAASGAVAAVVAAVVIGPGMLGASQRDAGPDPAPSPPVITDGRKVSFDLGAPEGEAPRVLYQRTTDGVAIDAEGEHPLPEGTTQVVPYQDGYVAVADGDSPLEVKQRLYRLDADFQTVEDLGPVLAPVAFTADGSRIAWAEIGPDRAATIVRDDGAGILRTTLPAGQLPRLVGFTGAGTVLSLDDGDQDLGDRVLDAQGGLTELRGLEYVWDASPVSDLVVGNARWDDRVGLACAGTVRDGTRIRSQCHYQVEDLGPDGSLVIAYPDEATPSNGRLTVLDAETLEPRVRFVGDRGARIVEAAWEDDDHVLAVVEQGDRQSILRLGLDGTVERTTAFETVRSLSTTWFLAGRPF